ncbi:MAG: RNA-binding S4 domain-containing protein [Bacteroidetes bacterium]|nr:RNA-binding S4 domain-containing protein [Bacteroidota bacterium]
MDSIRIDKWLWTVRIFKSRTMASDACKGSKIRIASQIVKPSREVKVGEIVTIQQNPIIKTVKVKQILKNRVSATLAAEAMEDLTPAEEYEKLKFNRELNHEWRDHGVGRPTKKDRRDIDRLKDVDL